MNNGSVQRFTFDSSVIARYIQVYATKLGKVDVGNYLFQLIEVNSILTNIAASSNLKGWPVSHVLDNNTSSNCSSQGNSSESGTEWVVFNLENIETVGGIRLTPRGTLEFPKYFI
ncbi:discoidin domain-containing protein [Paenibacillus sp. NPDC057934]|uniref:discoidin domain-containing protein n=1 Tax=Paenibacillus sp. NPDC057934 TaxID=3346282 RepID=UPI0036D89234